MSAVCLSSVRSYGKVSPPHWAHWLLCPTPLFPGYFQGTFTTGPQLGLRFGYSDGFEKELKQDSAADPSIFPRFSAFLHPNLLPENNVKSYVLSNGAWTRRESPESGLCSGAA